MDFFCDFFCVFVLSLRRSGVIYGCFNVWRVVNRSFGLCLRMCVMKFVKLLFLSCVILLRFMFL